MKIFLVQFFCVFLQPLLNIFCCCSVHTISVLYWAHLCMECSLGISTFLEEVFQFSSVAQSCPLFANPWTSARQASLSITNSQSPPNPCPLCWWCHPTISSSVVPFSSCPQSLPESGSFQMSQLFATRGQGVGVSDSTSVPPMNTQDWSPLGWTGWISLQSKGFSRVFNTTVQKNQFFNAQLSL